LLNCDETEIATPVVSDPGSEIVFRQTAM